MADIGIVRGALCVGATPDGGERAGPEQAPDVVLGVAGGAVQNRFHDVQRPASGVGSTG